MDQKTREEFEKLSKANQEWVMEVCRLLGMLRWLIAMRRRSPIGAKSQL